MIHLLLALLLHQAPVIPTLPLGPIFLEWDPDPAEGSSGIVSYEVMTNRFMAWTVTGVAVPAPTYRWQIPPEHLWVDTFDLGLKGCTSGHDCSDVRWTTFRVVAAGTLPTAPKNPRIGGLMVTAR